jgi:hypothetical protein
VLTEKRKGTKGAIFFVDENNLIVSKFCSTCNENKALEDFCVRKTGLGGRDSTCKVCAVQRSIKNYHANKEPHLERSRKQQEIKRQQKEAELGPIPDWRGIHGKRGSKGVAYYESSDGNILAKSCTKCGEVKKLDYFAILKLGLGGRVSICKECRVKDYELNRQHEIERVLKHQRDNPDKNKLRQHRRRARKKTLPNDFAEEQMTVTHNYFGGCALTGSSEIDWDHVVPLASGHGGTTYGNMIPLRSDLNKSKNDANIFEWFSANKERYHLSQERFDALVLWLAKANGMTTEKYQEHVYKCFNNANELGSHSQSETA